MDNQKPLSSPGQTKHTIKHMPSGAGKLLSILLEASTSGCWKPQTQTNERQRHSISIQAKRRPQFERKHAVSEISLRWPLQPGDSRVFRSFIYKGEVRKGGSEASNASYTRENLQHRHKTSQITRESKRAVNYKELNQINMRCEHSSL